MWSAFSDATESVLSNHAVTAGTQVLFEVGAWICPARAPTPDHVMHFRGWIMAAEMRHPRFAAST